MGLDAESIQVTQVMNREFLKEDGRYQAKELIRDQQEKKLLHEEK